MKRRLELGLNALATTDDEELDFWRELVRRMYHAAFGNERTMRWLNFARALESETIRQTKERAADAVAASRVVERYARVFPDLAAKLDTTKVEAAVLAWRSDLNQWKAVRVALEEVASIPTARSMATQWSKKRLSGVQSRKRRPPKRPRPR